MTNALKSFLRNIVTARELADKIKEYADEHMHKYPEKINWADVGDSAHLVQALMFIVDEFNIK